MQTHEEPDPTNSMEERSTSTTCTGSGDDLQDSCGFVSLTTGKVLNRHSWTEAPIANNVIARVGELAVDDAPDHLVFGDRCGDQTEEPEDTKMAGVVPVIAGVDDDDTEDDNATHDSNTTIQEQEQEDNEEMNFPEDPEQKHRTMTTMLMTTSAPNKMTFNVKIKKKTLL